MFACLLAKILSLSALAGLRQVAITFQPNFAYSSAKASPWLAFEPVISTVGTSFSADAGKTTASAITDTKNRLIELRSASAKNPCLLNGVCMLVVLALTVGHLRADQRFDGGMEPVYIIGIRCP
jgi:hypothetical protein